MGYQIISTTSQTSETGLGISYGSSPIFSPIYTTQQQTKENLKTLLLTRVGERYMLPTYGTNLLNILFQPGIGTFKEELQDIIINPITEWLPYITIENIEIKLAEDDPSFIHDVHITISYTVDNFSTDSIQIYSDGSSISVE